MADLANCSYHQIASLLLNSYLFFIYISHLSSRHSIMQELTSVSCVSDFHLSLHYINELIRGHLNCKISEVRVSGEIGEIEISKNKRTL